MKKSQRAAGTQTWKRHMRLIFIGPPGSGKGTQTKLLSQRLGLSHIGTGDMLREAVRQKSPSGQLAESYVSAGQLVPDQVVNDIIAELFAQKNRASNFVMDGYPRTMSQARAFDDTLNLYNLPLDGVILLVVPDQEIIRRLSARWNCPNPTCNATYHTSLKPPKVAGVCDECGSTLMQREDDREETVRMRLKIYHDRHAELLDHYRKKGLLIEVPGLGDFEIDLRQYRAGDQSQERPVDACSADDRPRSQAPPGTETIFATVSYKKGVVFREFFNKAPELKSPREIGLMREAGKIVAEALAMCRDMAKPGVALHRDRQSRGGPVRPPRGPAALQELHDSQGARCRSRRRPASPSTNRWCTAFPGQREIRDGDLVKIDTACKLNGWCADAAITVLVGNVRPERRRLVEAGERVLHIAIEEMGRRRWWSEVASHMQRFAEGTGFSVVKNYVGHGIGRTMHENPQVPNYVSREMKKQDFRLEEGLVLAVEPMLNMGRRRHPGAVHRPLDRRHRGCHAQRTRRTHAWRSRATAWRLSRAGPV